MFDVFSFLYFVTVHSTPYLFHLYTTSLHTYMKLVIFSSQIFIFFRNNLYDKTTFVGSDSQFIIFYCYGNISKKKKCIMINIKLFIPKLCKYQD
jgi:hypothetical protein